VNLFQKESGGAKHEYLVKIKSGFSYQKAWTTHSQDKITSPHYGDGMGGIPWIDPLHISLEMLCYLFYIPF
jgi:hypothetical protein